MCVVSWRVMLDYCWSLCLSHCASSIFVIVRSRCRRQLVDVLKPFFLHLQRSRTLKIKTSHLHLQRSLILKIKKISQIHLQYKYLPAYLQRSRTLRIEIIKLHPNFYLNLNILYFIAVY
uniref:Secreted protein n=1 Tax=Cacopsylla melanoneura TaxID=428564 RepID=A0A8D9F4B8_9HEMI